MKPNDRISKEHDLIMLFSYDAIAKGAFSEEVESRLKVLP